MGWGNPVVGGTVLAVAAIQSPDFNLAARTGWAIFQNGSAFFFNVTAEGNVTADQLFLYNGTPAKGSLFMAISETAGTDAFGNNFGQGLNIGVWSAVTGNMQQHLGVDNQGNLYLADSTGSTRIYLSPSATLLSLYTASTANLIATIAAASQTDPFTSQTILPGFTVYGSGANAGKAISLQVSSGNPTLFFFSGKTEEDIPAQQSLQIDNIGLPNELLNLFIIGPSVNASPDRTFINLQSAPANGSGPAGGNLVYTDTGGTDHALLQWGKGGLIHQGYSDGNNYQVGELVLFLAADQTINTFAFQVINGLTCGMAANSVYQIEGTLLGQNITAAVADLWAITFPPGSSATLTWNFIQLAGSGGGLDNTGISNGSMTSPAYATSARYMLQFQGIVQTGASSGSMEVQGSESVSGDTWKAQQNSFVKVRSVSGG